MDGPAARMMAAHHEAILSVEYSRRMPPMATSPTEDQQADFRAYCDEQLTQTLDKLSAVAPTLPCEVLLGVPLLLGQPDFAARTISTGPNAFGYEIELLSGLAVGPSYPEACGAASRAAPRGPAQSDDTGHDFVQRALDCLALARKVRLYTHFGLLGRPGSPPPPGGIPDGSTNEDVAKDPDSDAESDVANRNDQKDEANVDPVRPAAALGGTGTAFSALGDALAVNWLFERGRFSMEYDAAVARRIHIALCNRGYTPTDPSGLFVIGQAFLKHWHTVYRPFVDRCDRLPVLRAWLRQPTLLDRPLLAGSEFDLVCEFLPQVWIEYADLLALGPEVTDWLPVITLALPVRIPNSQAPGAVPARDVGEAPREREVTPDPYAVAGLRSRPIVTSNGRALLVMPHRLETDVTDLLDHHWGPQYRENYFVARGAVVEEFAFETLMRLPQAVGIGSGKYTSADKRTNGETDGLVIWNRTAFVIEAKGGFLSDDARRGAHASAIADVRETVGAAYFQAVRLLRLLDEHGSVELRGPSGQDFVLHRDDIDRAHVLIPTADDFGNVAVATRDLAAAGILPAGATPLIASGQEIALLFDLLSDPADIGAYFLFREEVLAHRAPLIWVADELEILGSYIAGTDIVGRARSALRGSGDSDAILIADPTMQRHVDDWQNRRRQNPRSLPPIRHDPSTRAAATVLISLGRIVDAWHLLRTGSEEAIDAFARIPLKPRVRPTVSFSRDITVVASIGSIPNAQRRELVKQHRLSRTRQIWMVKRYSSKSAPTLYEVHAHQEPFYPAELLKTVEPVALRRWYEEFSDKHRKRRRGGHDYDEALVASLVNQGLSNAMSRGLCRAGLVPQLQETVRYGAPINKAADFWLNEVKTFARTRSVSVADLSVPPAEISTLVAAVIDRTLPTHEIRPALAALLDNGTPVAAFIAALAPSEPLSEAELLRPGRPGARPGIGPGTPGCQWRNPCRASTRRSGDAGRQRTEARDQQSSGSSGHRSGN